MRRSRPCAALAALLLGACQAESTPPAITIEDAWARATVPGQPSAAVYLTVRNDGGEDRLVEVSSPAGDASLHSTSMDNGVIRMRHLQNLDIPANSSVALEPGATHIMVTGLEQPLGEGTTFPLELKFDRSGDRRVSASVRAAAASGAHM